MWLYQDGSLALWVHYGNLLPGRVLSALGVALYGMFLAIIIPPAKDNKIISGIILVSMVLSLMFTNYPY